MKIALGVTGGIAAYKAAEILRLLQERGFQVQVIMTRAAQEFVRPLTFASNCFSNSPQRRMAWARMSAASHR